MFSELFPILATADLPRAIAFYRDLLGGKVDFEYPGTDGAPVYVGIEIGSTHLGIGRDQTPVERAGRSRISLWIYVSDCDAAVDLLRAGGVPIVQEPADQPWGERVARVADPDGNEIILGQRSDSD